MDSVIGLYLAGIFIFLIYPAWIAFKTLNYKGKIQKRLKAQAGFTIVEILYLVFLIAMCFAILGWILNIVQVCHMNFDHMTGFCILRVVGIFMPVIGAITGYIPN